MALVGENKLILIVVWQPSSGSGDIDLSGVANKTDSDYSVNPVNTTTQLDWI